MDEGSFERPERRAMGTVEGGLPGHSARAEGLSAEPSLIGLGSVELEKLACWEWRSNLLLILVIISEETPNGPARDTRATLEGDHLPDAREP